MLKKLLCKWFGHKWTKEKTKPDYTRYPAATVEKWVCSRCGEQTSITKR